MINGKIKFPISQVLYKYSELKYSVLFYSKNLVSTLLSHGNVISANSCKLLPKPLTAGSIRI